MRPRLLFCILGSALTQQTCPPVGERDAEVLVFGAGVTGITIARALYDNGLRDVLVLEARTDDIGGRMRNVTFGGVQIELGANWIEQAPNRRDQEGTSNPIWTIARSTDVCPTIFTSSTPLANFFSDYDNFKAFDKNGNDINSHFGAASGRVSKALEKLSEYSMERQSNGEGDITVRAALENLGWTPSNPTEVVAGWFKFDFIFAESPNVSSLFESFPAVSKYEFGDTDYFVTDQRGYASVVDCIAEGFPVANIRLGHTVSSISYGDDCVCASVTIASNGEERTMCGTYGVATFSVGVLQDFVNRSRFDPPISSISKLRFLDSIRMAYYLKIFVRFPETFWSTDVDYIIRSNNQRGRYPIIQPMNVLRGSPNIILVTVTEHEAVRISNQNVNTTKMEIMEVLREVYGNNIPDPVNILVPTWISDPLYRGMYSDTAFGLTVKDHQTFSEPEGHLFLSGEANIAGDNGYVHSGYCSGMETSGAILQATGRSTGKGNLPSCPLTAGAPRAAVSALL